MATDVVHDTWGALARRRYVILAGWFGVGAAQLLLVAAHPPRADTNSGVLAGLGVGLILLACLALLLGPRVGETFHVTLVSIAILIPMLTAFASVSGQGQLLCGVYLIAVGAYVGYFMPRRAVLVLLSFMILTYGLALAVVPVIDSAFYAVFVEGTIVAVTLVIARLVSHLREMAVHDPLTGALNRRGLEIVCTRARDLDARLGRPTALVEIDLDGFKSYNDRHGHPAGDTLLRSTVAAWNGVLRNSDIVGRTGGDEFVLVLPNTDVKDTSVLLNRLRSNSASPWSAGVTEWRTDETMFEALARADAQLYLQKKVRTAPGAG